MSFSRNNSSIRYSFNQKIDTSDSREMYIGLFDNLKINIAESKVSEIVDLNMHKKIKNVNIIKSYLLNNTQKPFVFTQCLN